MTAAEKQARIQNWWMGLLSGLILLGVVGVFRNEGRMATMETQITQILHWIDKQGG